MKAIIEKSKQFFIFIYLKTKLSLRITGLISFSSIENVIKGCFSSWGNSLPRERVLLRIKEIGIIKSNKENNEAL